MSDEPVSRPLTAMSHYSDTNPLTEQAAALLYGSKEPIAEQSAESHTESDSEPADTTVVPPTDKGKRPELVQSPSTATISALPATSFPPGTQLFIAANPSGGPTPAASAPSARSIIAAPEPYDGTMERYHSFATHLDLFLDLNPTDYDTDKKKIGFLLSLLKGGTAQSWAAQKMRELLTSPSRWPKWTSFKADFEKQFYPIDLKKNAMAILTNIKQGSRTLIQYDTAFDTAQIQSGLTNDDMLVNLYLKGLSDRLRDAVESSYPTPTDLKGWKTRARDLDQVQNRRNYATDTYGRTLAPVITQRDRPTYEIHHMEINQLSPQECERRHNNRNIRMLIFISNHPLGHIFNAVNISD